MSRSFGITVRTRVGMNQKFKDQMSKWLKKQPYSAYVYEKEGSEEHIHAQIWIAEKRTKGNVMKPVTAIVKRCYEADEYIIKQAICIKDAYNDDFVEEYLTKDNSLEYEHLPEDTSEYYPTEEEQAKFMEISENKKNWTLWAELERLWDGDIINEYTIAKFLAHEMFVNRSIKVESDDRKRRQMCITFTAYLRKTADGTLFLAKDKHDIYKMYNV